MHKNGNILPVDNKNLAHIILERREGLGLKQDDLAEMARVGLKTIYLIEQGKANPSVDTLKKIFDVLGLEMTIQIKKRD